MKHGSMTHWVAVGWLIFTALVDLLNLLPLSLNLWPPGIRLGDELLCWNSSRTGKLSIRVSHRKCFFVSKYKIHAMVLIESRVINVSHLFQWPRLGFEMPNCAFIWGEWSLLHINWGRSLSQAPLSRWCQVLEELEIERVRVGIAVQGTESQARGVAVQPPKWARVRGNPVYAGKFLSISTKIYIHT